LIEERSAFDEHRHRPWRRARDLEHLVERVPIGIVEPADDDVGLGVDDTAQQIAHVSEDGDVVVAGFSQAKLDDGGAHRIVVDDENLEFAVRHGARFG
jgi:hypothetical protein